MSFHAVKIFSAKCSAGRDTVVYDTITLLKHVRLIRIHAAVLLRALSGLEVSACEDQRKGKQRANAKSQRTVNVARQLRASLAVCVTV